MIDATKKAGTAQGKANLESSLTAHLKTINDTLDPHEQLECLVLMIDAWMVDNDLITPNFKVKQHKIEDMFAANPACLASAAGLTISAAPSTG